MDERRLFWALGGVVALITAWAFSSVAIPVPHAGGDNAAYLSLGHALISGLGYTEIWDPAYAPHSKYPPVFPGLLAMLIALGASTWTTFKLVMALGLAGAVLFVFAWLARRVGPVAAAAIAVLTLLTGGWLQASRWILSEPWFLLLTFVTLWAIDGLDGRSEEGDFTESERRRRTILAGGAAILAFFTRSAGLPLVLALLGALVIAHRRRAAAALLACFGAPAAWWFARAAGGTEGAYQSEFWMVDPYQPELGNITWLDLPARVWTNLQLYIGDIVPGEWWPSVVGTPRVALGVILVGLAVWGWGARLRQVRTAELFVPLYLGLILLWPGVWSGDRFVLPLYPLVLLYAGETLWHGASRLGGTSAFVTLTVAFFGLASPTLPRLLAISADARTCRSVAEATDPIRCQGFGMQEFRNAAAWAGENLPDGSVVLSRKPRIHYLLGGPPSRTFPFSGNPRVLLGEADELQARYLLMDHVDGIAGFYLSEVIRGWPGAFCHIAGWGGQSGLPGTDLFGILPAEDRAVGAAVSDIGPCPDSYRTANERAPPEYGPRIPLLVRSRMGP